MQARARAGVEPREAAAEAHDLELAAAQVFHVHVGDFEFAARRGLEVLRDVHDFVVVNIDARHGVAALGRLGFFLDGNGPALRVELDHAVTLRVAHVVAEDDRAALELLVGAGEGVAAEENVVAENERHLVLADERFRDEKRLRDAGGFRLLAILDGDAPRLAVAEQLFEAWQIVRRGDEAEFPHAAGHEGGQRIIDHRFVVNRLELFAGDERERIQPRACAAGEDDAFHFHKDRDRHPA